MPPRLRLNRNRSARPSDATEITGLAAEVPSAPAEPIATGVDKPTPSLTEDDHDAVSYPRNDNARRSRRACLSCDATERTINLKWLAAITVAFARFSSWLMLSPPLGPTIKTPPPPREQWNGYAHDSCASATCMNPQVDYARFRLGHNDNHGTEFGVLDARCLAKVIDAPRLLRDSPDLASSDEGTIKHRDKSHKA